MDLFFIIGLIALCFIAIGFIGYSVITKDIIDDQEREISELKREIEKYESAYRGLNHVKRLVLSKDALSSDETRARIDTISGKAVNNFEDLFEEF